MTAIAADERIALNYSTPQVSLKVPRDRPSAEPPAISIDDREYRRTAIVEPMYAHEIAHPTSTLSHTPTHGAWCAFSRMNGTRSALGTALSRASA